MDNFLELSNKTGTEFATIKKHKIPYTAPRPKLCHLKKWSNEQGYGFHLYTQQDNTSLIGRIDPDSPAEATGLKVDDIILEVNFQDVRNKNHKEIVDIIRKGLNINELIQDDEVVLVVADQETKEYYDTFEISISSRLDNILVFETPTRVIHN